MRMTRRNNPENKNLEITFKTDIEFMKKHRVTKYITDMFVMLGKTQID